MEKILFINACVRENSRTLVLAEQVLKGYDGEIIRKDLCGSCTLPLNRERLYERDELIKAGKLDHESFADARELAAADRIVIAAPFWDLGFPALLKIYLESVMVSGITFNYDNGIPKGMCRGKSLQYVTTSGGMIFEDFGYSYIKTLAKCFFGIDDVSCVYAQNMDVECIDASQVLERAQIKEKR